MVTMELALALPTAVQLSKLQQSVGGLFKTTESGNHEHLNADQHALKFLSTAVLNRNH